eukprot:scaffold12993_cov96-Isochrysis_galbana.AAC.6
MGPGGGCVHRGRGHGADVVSLVDEREDLGRGVGWDLLQARDVDAELWVLLHVELGVAALLGRPGLEVGIEQVVEDLVGGCLARGQGGACQRTCKVWFGTGRGGGMFRGSEWVKFNGPVGGGGRVPQHRSAA